MIPSPIRKSVLLGVAGLSLTGALAGCAPAQSAPAPSSAASTASASAAVTSSAPAATAPASSAPLAQTSEYKDGTYSADGAYSSPNGQEAVGVAMTLSSGAVSDVAITVHASNPMTKKFQDEFSGGIKAIVVGRNLDELNVSKVAGSSLTGAGFNQAVEAIKTQAR